MRIGVVSKINNGPLIGSPVSYLGTHQQITAKTGLTPTLFFPNREASGNVTDTVSATALAAAGTISYRVPSGGTSGIYYGTNGGHAADVGDVGLNSCLFGAIATHDAGSGLPAVVGRSGSTSYPCIVMYRANATVTYPTLLVRDATTTSIGLTLPSVDVVTEKKPILYLGLIDRSTNLAYLLVASANRILGTTSGSIATHGTFSGGTLPKFHMGKSGAFGSGAVVSSSFLCIGSQVEGLNLTTLAKKLGFGGI